MDAVTTLLKCLKSKHFINDVDKAKSEVTTETITLRKEDDLFIRDAITGMGTILKEDLEHHYYITTIKVGTFGNTLTNQKDYEGQNELCYSHQLKRHIVVFHLTLM